MTVKPPAPPPLPDELDRLLRRLQAAVCAAGGAGGARDRQLAALGARRGAARAARRGGRRPRPGDHLDAPALLRAAGRQDVRRVGTRQASAIPKPTQQALRTLEWIERAEVLVRVRAERDRQEPLRRSARAPRDRQGQDRRVAHARDARCPVPPPPRRRQRQQSDQQADPRGPDHRR